MGAIQEDMAYTCGVLLSLVDPKPDASHSLIIKGQNIKEHLLQ